MDIEGNSITILYPYDFFDTMFFLLDDPIKPSYIIYYLCISIKLLKMILLYKFKLALKYVQYQNVCTNYHLHLEKKK